MIGQAVNHKKKHRQFRRHHSSKQYVPKQYPFPSIFNSSAQYAPLLGIGYMTFLAQLYGGERRLMGELQVVKQPQPVIAWKTIHVEYHRPLWELQTSQGVKHQDGIPATGAIALCNALDGYSEYPHVPASDHESNTEWVNCSCGFYGLKSHKSIPSTGYWLAKVRMYGKVIEGEKGYRATKQDILEVWPAEDYIGLNEPYEQLPEQFPTIKWHLPSRQMMPNYRPVKEKKDEEREREIALIHLDPFYDVLPKELVDILLPNQFYVITLPFLKNASMGLTAQFTTNNGGITLELRNYNNERILGPILFSGTKYHWYGPDGQPLKY